MVKSVEEKGGFWVGRYETSNMINSNNAIEKVNIVKGTKTGINNITWYRMYAQQEIYSQQALQKSTNIKSSMMWGSQWSQILIWMKNIRNEKKDSYYVTNHFLELNAEVIIIILLILRLKHLPVQITLLI